MSAAAIWNTALISAGAALGDQWEEVADVVSRLQTLVVAVVVIGVGCFVWRRLLRPRLERARNTER